MGLFDFMSDAGADQVTSTVEVSPERLNELRAENIAKSLAQLDIEGEQVAVSVNNGIAVLTGTAPSQETMEKMVLCAGNQHGIGQVDCRVEVNQPTVAATDAGQPSTSDAPGSAAPSTFYTVQSGDTLGKIAAEHYGNPGQSLRIPPL
jgi:LysM repeat protein